MVQSPGMALKSAMPVCLGGMPGMPGFRGEAKVGQLQGLHHLDLLAETGEFTGSLQVGIQESQTQGQAAA